MNESITYLYQIFQSGISPNEYAETISKRDSSVIDGQITSLLQFTGQDHISAVFFHDCLYFLATKTSDIAFVNQNLSDPQIALGLIRFILEYGDKFVNKLRVGSRNTAYSAIILLETCLISDESYRIKGINKLIQSPFFSVLIASAKVFCYQEYYRIRHLFQSVDPYSNDVVSQSPSRSSLMQALFSNTAQIQEHVFRRLDLSNLFSKTLYIKTKSIVTFNRLNPVLAQKIYFQAVNQFLNYPSLNGAYFITNYFTTIFPKIIKNHIKNPDLRSFHKDFILKVINKFDFTQNVDYLILTHEELTELLSRQPINLSPDNYVESIYQYPSLASDFPTYFINTMSNGDIKSTVILSKSEKLDFTFRSLLCHQELYTEFLNAQHYILSIIYDPTDFYVIFELYIQNIKLSWSSGFDHIKAYIKAHMDQISNSVLIPLLECISFRNDFTPNIEIPSNIDLIKNEQPILMTAYFFNLLFLPDINMDAVWALVSEYPFLWIPILIWARIKKVPPPLSPIKMPNSEIIWRLFHTYMLEVTEKDIIFEPRSSHAIDFERLVALCPKSVVTIAFGFSQSIKALINTQSISTAIVIDTVIIFKAWLTAYGIGPLVKEMLSILSSEVRSQTDIGVATAMYCATALMLSISAGYETDKIIEMIDATVDMVAENNEFVKDTRGDCLGQFLAFLFLSIDTGWEPCFGRVMDLCQLILKEDQPNSARMTFALTVIKIALYNSTYQPHIPDNLFEVIIKQNDYTTAIDFFIAMGNISRSTSCDSDIEEPRLIEGCD